MVQYKEGKDQVKIDWSDQYKEGKDQASTNTSTNNIKFDPYKEGKDQVRIEAGQY